jgi:hypothetical protein
MTDSSSSAPGGGTVILTQSLDGCLKEFICKESEVIVYEKCVLEFFFVSRGASADKSAEAP